MRSSCTSCATAAIGTCPRASFRRDAMTPVLVFDIETIPDSAGLRKLLQLDESVSDAAVVDLATQRRRQAAGHDFLPAHVQRVVAISCALRDAESVRVWSLGGAHD